MAEIESEVKMMPHTIYNREKLLFKVIWTMWIITAIGMKIFGYTTYSRFITVLFGMVFPVVILGMLYLSVFVMWVVKYLLLLIGIRR
jgi:hypothetical protein